MQTTAPDSTLDPTILTPADQPPIEPQLADTPPIAAEMPSETDAPASFWRREIKVFTSTFVTIFLAELGDKTQMTTLLMSAESHSPWIVFAGAGVALVATSLIGVLVGRWLSNCVSPRTLERSAGVLLMVVAILLLWDVLQF